MQPDTIGDSSRDDRLLLHAAQAEADAFAGAVGPTQALAGEQLPPPASDSYPGYEILREIHRGGQGVVYQAIQKATKRKVALKVMRHGPFADVREKVRFEREVEILGRLRHPNIVAIHDSGSAAGSYYFVMDYISGQPLDVHVASGERSIDQILRLFVKIGDAVHSAHLRGIIHRDLKPSNIRIDTLGEPHVLDFGLAKLAAAGTGIPSGSPADDRDPGHDTAASKAGGILGPAMVMTITGQFVGSLPWASPEQAEGSPEKIDVRTDVYSLGVILFQMLTGRFPYDVVGDMRTVLDNIIKAEPRKLRSIRRAIDDEVETIVLRCLCKQRDRRYQSAGELARDLGRYLAGEAIEAKRDSSWYLLRKSLRRHRLKLVAVAALLLAVTVTAGVYSQRLASERQARLSAQQAALVARQQALDARAAWLDDLEQLAVLLGRAAAGEPLGERDAQETEALFAELAARMRAGALAPVTVQGIARLMVQVAVTGRGVTAVDSEPGLHVNISGPRAFSLPGIAIVVSPELRIDSQLDHPRPDAAMVPVRAYEFVNAIPPTRDPFALGWPIPARRMTQRAGLHVLQGVLTVRFCEPRKPAPPGGYTVARLPSNADGRFEHGQLFAECQLPITPFRVLVANGLPEVPLEIRDPNLAALTQKRIHLQSLVWSPAVGPDGNAQRECWRIEIDFDEQFTYLGFEVELHDAQNHLLGSGEFAVNPDGSIHFNSLDHGILSLGLRGVSVDEDLRQMIGLAPAADLPRDVDGVPIYAQPVTVTLTPSRRAAALAPQADAYLAVSVVKHMPVTRE